MALLFQLYPSSYPSSISMPSTTDFCENNQQQFLEERR
jgi:hypothetical protein